MIDAQEIRGMLRDFQEGLRDWIAGYICRIFVRGRIAAVSTDDTGATLLVDRMNGFTSTQSGGKPSSFEAGRLEYAGHLVIPRLDEPAQAFSDGNNAVYLPVASSKYRPSGGQPGDSAIYSLSDGQQALLWTRQDGSATWDSGGGAHVELDKAEPRVRVKQTLHADHYAGNDLFPVITPGPALGTSPAGTALLSGTDAAMTVSLTITDPTAAAGLLCTIVFGGAYDGEPHLLGPFPKSLNLATPPPGGVSGTFYGVVLPSVLVLFNTIPWTPGTYRFSFGVMGNKA